MRLLKPFVFLSVAACLIAVSGMSFASASNIYIAQNAVGAANGTSCSAAYPYTFFNNSGNWGSGGNQIGPGTTVHLCGTFTASNGASGYLTFQGSGTSGSPITLLFGSEAVVQAAYWGLNGAIYSNGNSYLTLDGGINGIVQATRNGSSGGPCIGGSCFFSEGAKQICTAQMVFMFGNDISVKNLIARDAYVHTATSNDSNGFDAIRVGGSNVYVYNCTVHDAAAGIMNFYSGTQSGIFIHDNTVYNVNWGIAIGDANSNMTLSNVNLYKNTVHDASNWDSSGDYFHHDGLFIYSGNSGSHVNAPINVYNNYVYHFNGANCTADFFTSGWGTPQVGVGTVYLFNNVFDESGAACGNGGIAAGSSNMEVINNTLYSGAQPFDYNTTGMVLENNVAYATGLYFEDAGIARSDYNDWYSIPSPGFTYNGSQYDALAAWSSATGFDTSSITSSPILNANYQPQSGSPIIGTGINFYSVCNGKPNPGLGALCYDAAGNARPSAGSWTIGAYNPSSILAPPSSLSAVVH